MSLCAFVEAESTVDVEALLDDNFVSEVETLSDDEAVADFIVDAAVVICPSLLGAFSANRLSICHRQS